jgi:Holliday junction resolvase-like predicted endonuclease
MPRYAAKVDAGHSSIRDALRQFGWKVHDTSRLGGFVDLVATRNGQVALIEVKTGHGKAGKWRATKSQTAMIEAGWPITVLTTVEEAITWAQSAR